jgi:hypothetical protein
MKSLKTFDFEEFINDIKSKFGEDDYILLITTLGNHINIMKNIIKLIKFIHRFNIYPLSLFSEKVMDKNLSSIKGKLHFDMKKKIITGFNNSKEFLNTLIFEWDEPKQKKFVEGYNDYLELKKNPF